MSDKNSHVFARCPGAPYDANNIKVTKLDQEGLTFREYAAVEAMKGLLSNPGVVPTAIAYGQLANWSRKAADALIKDLSENP